MKHLCAIIISFIFMAFAQKPIAQVIVINPTNTTPNLAATYPTLGNAITALNTITAISGPVTISLNASNPQTAPPGGYVINFIAATTGANNITISGSNNVITASNTLTAGSITDAIFKLVGADHVTIQDFTMQENPANIISAVATNNMTEWGVALLYASVTNGAQNNIILNNTISLNKAYSNSFGIYSNTRHSATAPSVDVTVTNNTTGPNHANKVYGNVISNVNMGITFLGSSNADYMDAGNDIGGTSAATGNTISNWGGIAAISNYITNTGTCYGIYINHQKGENVSNNSIISATINSSVAVRGIYKDFSTTIPTGTFTSNITNNSITLTRNVTGTIEGIRSEGITMPLNTSTLNINNNSLLNLSVGAANSSTNIIGIINTSQAGVVNMNDNVFRGNTSTATTGGFTAISSNGAVVTTLNVNNNKIGDALGNAISFSAVTNAAIFGINVPAVSLTANVSISGNNFEGFTQTVPGTGSHIYISKVRATSTATTDNINDNSFTNLIANTTGNVTFISRSGFMASGVGAVENCNNNRIVTAFSKPAAGGAVALFTTTATILGGNTMMQTGNDFSNITLSAGTTMNGWFNIEGAGTGPTKIISNNVFRNWICGTSAVTVLQSNNGGTNTSITGNIIENISCAGPVTAIVLGSLNKGALQSCSNNLISGVSSSAGTVLGITGGASTVTSFNIDSNRIGNLSTSGVGQVAAIRVSAANTVNIRNNKVYDISALNPSGLVFGVDISVVTASANYNIANNIIGNLTAPLTNNTLAIRGISVSSLAINSSFNIFYNTVYINAASSGVDFGTAALYLTANATATSGATSLRNNILVNNSTANGTGLTVIHRRSTTALSNYAASSNNNIFYASTPSTANLIYYDGTNADVTLGTYKTRVGPTRDAGSYTELPPFLTLVGTSPDFLHLDPSAPSIAESNAVNILGYGDDFDGQPRQGNAGYTGTGSAPDIGADELEGTITELDPPVINYTSIVSPTCTFIGMTLAPVAITDATGIPLAGTLRPRLYYRKNTGLWFSQPGTFISGTATSSNWSFTINEADMGGVSSGDIISYYIIAQDIVLTPNVGSNPSVGLVASNVNNISSPPSPVNSYLVSYNLNGIYTVGVGGDFQTLSAAAAAYNNACSLTGPVIFELIDNAYPAETFPITINNHADASISNTLTIRPSATATPLITGSATTQIIHFTGARYIVLDGRQGGTGAPKSLSFTNNSVLGNTCQFSNDAQYNRIQYCVVKGSGSSQTRAVILFGTAAISGTGNDNNVIDNNDISDGIGVPANGVFSSGTVGRENSNNFITNNNIFNFFRTMGRSVGINLFSANQNWTVTGNRLYQTAPRVSTLAGDYYGMWFNSGDGYTISNNVVGHANEAGTGSTILMGNSTAIAGFPAAYTAVPGTEVRFIGISCNFADGGNVSFIDGNTISGISMYTSSPGFSTYGIFCGIYVEGGNAEIGNNTGNVIGSVSGTGSIYTSSSSAGATVFGIRAGSTGSIRIEKNTIGGIDASSTSGLTSAGFTGISTGGFGSFTLNNNRIGNPTPNNIKIGYLRAGADLSNAGTLTSTTDGTAGIRGIISSTSGGSIIIKNNTLQGWATSNTAAAVSGIETFVPNALLNPAIRVDSNHVGSATAGWLTYAFPNTASLKGISIENASFLSATYFISNNDIRGINYLGPTSNTGVHDLINVDVTLAFGNDVTVSKNTFTNLLINTTGNTTFINHSYNVSSSGVQTIDSNRIVGTFSRTGNSGELFLLSSNGFSQSGARVHHINNNFSNISVIGSTVIRGFQNADGFGNPIKIIEGNTCTNWSAGTGSIRVFDYDRFGGTRSSISGNTISNISSQGAITGIQVNTTGNASAVDIKNNNISALVSGANVDAISYNMPANRADIDGNTIHTLSSTGNSSGVNGISTGGSAGLVNLNKNKIYDLSGDQSGSTVTGIAISAGNLVNVVNNYIGDLRTPLSGIAGRSITGLYINGGTTINSYYNTIHLNGTSSAALFSSAAVYANTIPTVNFRNNIFSNISVPGSSGKTVAYWRSSANLATYSSVANNNLLYAGIPSSDRLLYFDESNSDQTLNDFKLRVNPRDDNSVTGLPAFLSIIGADPEFLHLDATSNCGILGNGNNSGILIADDYDADVRSTSSPFITDIGADESGKVNLWSGANGTSWNDAGNWAGNFIPNGVDISVTITSAAANQPVILAGETFQVANINIGSGAILTNRGTLKVFGTISSPPAGIDNFLAGVASGSLELNGACGAVQAVSGIWFTNNSVKDLTISNDVSLVAAAGNQLNIAGTLAFGAVTGKTFTTGDNLNLLSFAGRTANVADISGNVISGTATVERYINTGLIADGRHLKSWQFLSTPTVGQTIFDSWQEGGTVPPGYGTIITGTGSGFDATTALPSLKKYNDLTNTWVGISNTGAQVNNPNGYMLFVRGDRSVTAFNQDAVPTILRTSGTLYQPSFPPPVVPVMAGKTASVGNPYASAIDLVYMKDNGLFTNLDNDVSVWDPLVAGSYNLGGYQVLSAANNYEPTAGSTATSFYPAGVPSPYIQSGQAFFVHSSGPAGSVSFNEACKESSSRLVHRNISSIATRMYFRASLFTQQGLIADGNAVVFDRGYSNSIDADDSYKIENPGENFGLIRDGQNLAVEARKPVRRIDTVYYKINSLRPQTYQLKFAPKNMANSGVRAFLIDRYMNSRTALSIEDSSFINFTVTGDSRTYAADRFYVVFKQRSGRNAPPHDTRLREHLISKGIISNDPTPAISVYPNPLKGQVLQIRFVGQLAGLYNLQLTNSAGQIVWTNRVILDQSDCMKSLKLGVSITSGIYSLAIYSDAGNKTVLPVLVD